MLEIYKFLFLFQKNVSFYYSINFLIILLLFQLEISEIVMTAVAYYKVGGTL